MLFVINVNTAKKNVTFRIANMVYERSCTIK